MGFFDRFKKQSDFSRSKVTLGSNEVGFLKPTKKELKQLGKTNPRLSNRPRLSKTVRVKIKPPKKSGINFNDEFKFLDQSLGSSKTSKRKEDDFGLKF